jgi:hypothetical protein
MILGVGTDHTLYTRPSVSGWTQVPESGPIKDVAFMPNGVIVGVGYRCARPR